MTLFVNAVDYLIFTTSVSVPYILYHRAVDPRRNIRREDKSGRFDYWIVDCHGTQSMSSVTTVVHASFRTVTLSVNVALVPGAS
jgi:hypothetical protein